MYPAGTVSSVSWRVAHTHGRFDCACIYVCVGNCVEDMGIMTVCTPTTYELRIWYNVTPPARAVPTTVECSAVVTGSALSSRKNQNSLKPVLPLLCTTWAAQSCVHEFLCVLWSNANSNAAQCCVVCVATVCYVASPVWVCRRF